MSAKGCLLSTRGSLGLEVFEGPPALKSCTRKEGSHFRVSTFSRDGSLLAYCDGRQVFVESVADFKVLLTLDLPRTTGLGISPLNSVLAAWEQYIVTKDRPAGTPNLSIWDIKTGNLLRQLMQKASFGWCPQWSSDEEIAARNVNNEIHFFEKNDFTNIAKKLQIQKVQNFSIATNLKPPYYIIIYAPGTKGQPSYVRMFQYPDFDGTSSALAHKSFYQADRVELIWNKKGSACLVLTASDTSAESYYGDQGLHFLSANGDSCLVSRGKNGPVYDVSWNPNSASFCAVYGFMPAKATIYNLKAEAIFDFGTGPRNSICYNPQGNMLALYGFGNLAGNMEFWDMETNKLLSNFKLNDTTHFEWCPDGAHFVSSTCAPRLRVGNGYKIGNYHGEILYEHSIPADCELLEVKWQPALEGVFAKPWIQHRNPDALAAVAAAAPAAYVPPHLRGKAQTTTGSKPKYLEEFEPPSNLKENAQSTSKAALKNKKKREAKKARDKENEDGDSVNESSANSHVEVTYFGDPQAIKNLAHEAVPRLAVPADPEVDKKIKKVKKKLEQIEKLKEKKAAGEKMEVNQIEKLKSEAALLKELEELSL